MIDSNLGAMEHTRELAFWHQCLQHCLRLSFSELKGTDGKYLKTINKMAQHIEELINTKVQHFELKKEIQAIKHKIKQKEHEARTGSVPLQSFQQTARPTAYSDTESFDLSQPNWNLNNDTILKCLRKQSQREVKNVTIPMNMEIVFHWKYHCEKKAWEKKKLILEKTDENIQKIKRSFLEHSTSPTLETLPLFQSIRLGKIAENISRMREQIRLQRIETRNYCQKRQAFVDHIDAKVKLLLKILSPELAICNLSQAQTFGAELTLETQMNHELLREKNRYHEAWKKNQVTIQDLEIKIQLITKNNSTHHEPQNSQAIPIIKKTLGKFINSQLNLAYADSYAKITEELVVDTKHARLLFRLRQDIETLIAQFQTAKGSVHGINPISELENETVSGARLSTLRSFASPAKGM